MPPCLFFQEAPPLPPPTNPKVSPARQTCPPASALPFTGSAAGLLSLPLCLHWPEWERSSTSFHNAGSTLLLSQPLPDILVWLQPLHHSACLLMKGTSPVVPGALWLRASQSEPSPPTIHGYRTVECKDLPPSLSLPPSLTLSHSTSLYVSSNLQQPPPPPRKPPL